MQAEFIASKQLLPGVVSFWFKPPSGFIYQAGDYTEVSVGLAGVADRRWLSIASAPVESRLQFTIKIGSPPSTFKQALLGLHPGQIVYLSPPMGNFNAPTRPDNLLFIAGGVGITPFRSILLQESQHPVGHDIRLLWTAKPGQFLFESELTKTKASVNKYPSDRRRLDLAAIQSDVDDVNDRLIFLAGPQPMTEGLYEQLLQSGHPRWRLRLCYFPGYKQI
jgi:ferredoxin-NADP reductase